MKQYKFVIAPDSFKESVDAFRACEAMKAGVSRVFSDATYEVIPMADGGEGTSQVITFAKQGEFVEVDVTGPLNTKVKATYGYVASENTAILEVAEGCGLHLVKSEMRNPLDTTTYGVGEIILDALEKGAKHLVIGLGGSATNDGGVGMMQALGTKFYDKDGVEVGLGGKVLSEICDIDIEEAKEKLQGVSIEIASDVENPLVGKDGATHVFGPQKGAIGGILSELEEGMKNFASKVEEKLGINLADAPKAGAAGGLGGAFMLFGCEMKKGIDLVIEHTNFEERVKDADYILTGEGSIDAQTKFGKTISGIAKVAMKYDIPVVAMAGCVGDDVDELYDIGVTSVIGIVDSAKTIEKALEDGYKSIEKASCNVARLIQASNK